MSIGHDLYYEKSYGVGLDFIIDNLPEITKRQRAISQQKEIIEKADILYENLKVEAILNNNLMKLKNEELSEIIQIELSERFKILHELKSTKEVKLNGEIIDYDPLLDGHHKIILNPINYVDDKIQFILNYFNDRIEDSVSYVTTFFKLDQPTKSFINIIIDFIKKYYLGFDFKENPDLETLNIESERQYKNIKLLENEIRIEKRLQIQQQNLMQLKEENDNLRKNIVMLSIKK